MISGFNLTDVIIEGEAEDGSLADLGGYPSQCHQNDLKVVLAMGIFEGIPQGFRAQILALVG